MREATLWILWFVALAALGAILASLWLILVSVVTRLVNWIDGD